MSEHPEILYTAEATATGRREGHARTSGGTDLERLAA
jgi:organic hydroperoxide reductase OsmC/OhrA